MIKEIQITIDSAIFKEGDCRWQVTSQLIGLNQVAKTSISGKTANPLFNINAFNIPVAQGASEILFQAFKI